MIFSRVAFQRFLRLFQRGNLHVIALTFFLLWLSMFLQKSQTFSRYDYALLDSFLTVAYLLEMLCTVLAAWLVVDLDAHLRRCSAKIAFIVLTALAVPLEASSHPFTVCLLLWLTGILSIIFFEKIRKSRKKKS